MQPDSLYIDGKWRAASNGATFTIINPATEEPLGQMASATDQDVDAAIAAAQKGFEIWRRVQPWERAKLIRRVGDLLCEREGDIAKALTLERSASRWPRPRAKRNPPPSSSNGLPRKPNAFMARLSKPAPAMAASSSTISPWAWSRPSRPGLFRRCWRRARSRLLWRPAAPSSAARPTRRRLRSR